MYKLVTKHILARTGLLLFCLAFSVFARAGDVAQLHLHLSSLKTLQAKFEQEVRDEGGALLQSSRGDIAVERPNKLRWESREPFHYQLISDGETLWRYDADLEQLNTEPFSEELAAAPAMIIGASIEQLEKQFDVDFHKQGSLREFTLHPKQPGMFNQIKLRFEQGRLIGMAMQDNLAQYTEVRFIKPRYNQRIDASVFRYTAPAP